MSVLGVVGIVLGAWVALGVTAVVVAWLLDRGVPYRVLVLHEPDWRCTWCPGHPHLSGRQALVDHLLAEHSDVALPRVDA